MPRQQFSDVDLIAALNASGGNITGAAEILGVSRTAVIKRKRSLPDGLVETDVTNFRQKRADTFAELQQIILRYVTPQKLKQASLSQLGTLFGIFYDKERLERGQATEHIAHAHFNKLDDRTRALLADAVKKMTEEKLNAISYDE